MGKEITNTRIQKDKKETSKKKKGLCGCKLWQEHDSVVVGQ